MKSQSHIEQRPLHRYMVAMNRIQPYRTTRALWLAVCSAIILSIVMVLGAISPETHRLQPVFHVEYVVVCNLILFALLYLFNFRVERGKWKVESGSWLTQSSNQAIKQSSMRLFGIGLLGSLIITFAASFIFHLLEEVIYGQAFNPETINIIINTSSAFIAYLISQLLYNVTEHQRTLVEKEHLQAENLRIHHEALEQQMSPHYLFNSLNTLDGLIGIDDNRAHSYLRQLAATLRYTLQQSRDVSLADELQFTRSYVYLMQTRYGDALRINIDIPDSMLTRRVPAISLQLLIENAIKHNVITQRYPLEITVKTIEPQSGKATESQSQNVTELQSDKVAEPKSDKVAELQSHSATHPLSHSATQTLLLEVSNPLRPKTDAEASNGIGLDNLAMRYKLLFNKEITIIHADSTFTVQMPLISKN